ncbi:MAG: ornithine carbamoyltransferase [Thermomicrobiales bacterium]|nr:ornithine carbamoyltransferase [Thermomicrobiales bacterium]
MESAAQSTSYVPTTPDLKPVPSVNQHLTGPATDRTSLLGGPTMAALPSFSVSTRMRGRHLLTDTDLSPEEIAEIIDTASRLKRMHKNGQPHHYLTGKSIGMIFQMPSTRTRVSLEAGMAQLGGQAIFLGVNDLQTSRGETIADTAQILSRYVDGVVARVYDHNTLVEMGENASIPVMNGLSNLCHPLQAWADLLTLTERFGDLKGLKIAYMGDGNNMVASLMLSGAAMGVSVTAVTPQEYSPSEQVVNYAQWIGASTGAQISVSHDPHEGVKGADVVYTDVHVSMGQENAAHRAVTLAPFKVTPEIMESAGSEALFMHCLPMHRDEEVSSAVVDGPNSIIFDQAENRLHMHKALLVHTLC